MRLLAAVLTTVAVLSLAGWAEATTFTGAGKPTRSDSKFLTYRKGKLWWGMDAAP